MMNYSTVEEARELVGWSGAAPHTLAVLNSFVLALFDFCQVSNAKQFTRRLDAQPLHAVRLLLTSLAEN